MKKFLNTLLSDSNKQSSKRLIGLICLIMFVAFGIKGLISPFDLKFAMFYVSLCSFTIWIAFRFMSAEKALKYNVLGQLSNLEGVALNAKTFRDNEQKLDNIIDDHSNNFNLLKGGTQSNVRQSPVKISIPKSINVSSAPPPPISANTINDNPPPNNGDENDDIPVR